MIFAVDFEAVPSVVDSRGRLSKLIQESKLFPKGGLLDVGVNASKITESYFCALNVAWDKIGWDVETQKCTPEANNPLIKLTEKIIQDIGVNKVKRIGVRFFFLAAVDSFELANKKISENVDSDFLRLFAGDCVDSSVIFIFEKDKTKSKVTIGPLKKAEYPQWFNKPNLIEFENGYLCDFDSFTLEYKYQSIHVEKFISESYNYALATTKNVFSSFNK